MDKEQHKTEKQHIEHVKSKGMKDRDILRLTSFPLISSLC